MGLLRRCDPASAQRLVDDVIALVGETPASLEAQSSLASHVPEVAEFDPEAACRLARTLRESEWTGPRTATVSVALARIAHRLLDNGHTDHARELSREVLAAQEVPAVLAARPSRIPCSRADTRPSSGPDTLFSGILYIMDGQRNLLLEREIRYFRHPSELVQAALPDYWRENSWARVVRHAAEHLTVSDHQMALRLVQSISDPAERATGLAFHYMIASGSGRTVEAAGILAEIMASLDILGEHVWTLPGGGDPDAIGVTWADLHGRDLGNPLSGLGHLDNGPLAYLRPDLRVRFEIMYRLLLHHMEAFGGWLDGAPYLHHAAKMTFLQLGSELHLSKILANEPVGGDQAIHRVALEPGGRYDPLITDIVLADAAANERRIVAATGRAPLGDLNPPIEDPLYAAKLLLVPLPGEQPAEGAVLRHLRPLLGTARLPAIASLLAEASYGTGSTLLDDQVRTLLDEVHRAAEDHDPWLNLMTKVNLSFAEPSVWRIDLLELLSDIKAFRLEKARDMLRFLVSESQADGLEITLFPRLLEEHPQDALRLLYETIVRDWHSAMTLLDRGMCVLVGSLPSNAIFQLNDALIRGLSCADSAIPDIIDGVSAPLTAPPPSPPSPPRQSRFRRLLRRRPNPSQDEESLGRGPLNDL